MAKKRKTSGKKHRIIFIRHSLNRVWRNLIVSDLILWGLWWAAPYIDATPFRPPNDYYLLIGGWVLLVFVILALLLRNMAFIQVRAKHILLALPLARIRIPYENVEGVRMVLYKNLYEKKGLSWANQRFMRPYRQKTMVTLHLNKFPMSEFFLKLFLPNYMFLPDEKGFLIYVKYYLEFNTEVDSRLNEARSFSADQPTRQTVTKDEEEAYDGYFNLFED